MRVWRNRDVPSRTGPGRDEAHKATEGRRRDTRLTRVYMSGSRVLCLNDKSYRYVRARVIRTRAILMKLRVIENAPRTRVASTHQRRKVEKLGIVD